MWVLEGVFDNAQTAGRMGAGQGEASRQCTGVLLHAGCWLPAHRHDVGKALHGGGAGLGRLNHANNVGHGCRGREQVESKGWMPSLHYTYAGKPHHIATRF